MMSMPNDACLDDLVAAIKTLLASQGRIYLHFAEATIERFGREGEMTVRLGLRAYGQWRGGEMRAAHHALGKDINMATLIGCWDNASTYVIKDDMEASGTFEPCNVRFDVAYCPAAEAWQDAEFFQWGHVYCDEFHQACASAYHPDGNVVIPQNMMKGDGHCHFQWVMPPGADVGELGALWYETVYPVMVAAYLPGAGAHWASLRARGDAVSRLELSDPGGPDA